MDVRKMNVRKRMALGAVALAAAATATLAPTAAASPSEVGVAAACTAWRTIQVDDNAAGVKYRECDRYSGLNTQTKAQLYIWDNKRDGKVAQVYTATGSNLNGQWHQSWHKYYVWGTESHHSPLVDTGWHKGHDVKVLLKNVRG
ncbi:hypothetical protein AMK26_30805 [Streptomyces sp. CB03234]|uniref:hypothetical protein n=1 Tax=Streptomyces sp. (strain CB03234) TaxID=1703937 RepID=UPI00093AB627|nr:hypothetical protein [Streptomyces sp. CB03234]OKJ95011.1 hypothetical protein AMK26_30805 [Streptomyces sp. CB03234]